MKRYLNDGQPPAPAGAYGFDRSATDQQSSPASDNLVGGSDFASILIGMGMAPGTEGNIGYSNFTRDIFAAESNPYYAAFVEDTYRPTSKLTITAGLRWDIFGGRNERHNRLEYFNPSVSNTSSGVSYTGAEIYVNNNNRSPFTTNMHDFGPRLGFTWQPVQHLVVRGGGGYYYGPSVTMVASPANANGFASARHGTQLAGTQAAIQCLTALPDVPLQTPVATLEPIPYNPFPSGLVPIFTKSPTGLAANLGTTLGSVLHSQRTMTTYNFNFGLEYELPHRFVVSVGYVGSRGLFLPFNSVDLNDLDLRTIQQYGASLCVDSSNPSCQMVANTWAPIQPSTNNNSGASTVPLWVSLQTVSSVWQRWIWGWRRSSHSRIPGRRLGIQLDASEGTEKLTNNFTTLATFTWGKLMTDDGFPPLQYVGSHAGKYQGLEKS